MVLKKYYCSKDGEAYDYYEPTIDTFYPQRIVYGSDGIVIDMENGTSDSRSIMGGNSASDRIYYFIDTMKHQLLHLRYGKLHGKDFMTHYNRFEEIILKLRNYAITSTKNDTSSTIGRWYGAGGMAGMTRLFKKNGKFYMMEYWKDGEFGENGKGFYHEVNLTEQKDGIKVEMKLHNKDDEDKSYYTAYKESYYFIDFKDENRLSFFIQGKKVDRGAAFAECFLYNVSIIDSMFYYGYDTIPHTIEYYEPRINGGIELLKELYRDKEK